MSQAKFELASQRDYDESTKQKIDQHSGLKVWESAYDLCTYLEELDWSGITNVIELGCGHGLPGLVALNHGKKVTFQDYDAVTLELTKQTLTLNSTRVENANFVSGAWENFSPIEKFDLVLASEAVYDAANFRIFSDVIASSLARNGRALVAGKKFYFGCGGGTLGFADFAAKSEHRFKVTSVRTIEDKRSNIREILELRL
jgi:predicted nicotinamide N-methyase